MKNFFNTHKTDIFETIWSNTNLRESLFPRENYADELNNDELRNLVLQDFKTNISLPSNSFYSFIKVK